ncbi:hypothetical protein IFM89_003419 [Coptis chinensis]|uniref:NB-ARC domain-containing protein n=1 Tax=Coptis chinensis TaxID=261450 RepID=A0A835GTW3_9MAGN|nr:hypothetical protein IFM89_003419 [Coptis chinensis]
MSRETVLVFINRLDDAIRNEGSNSMFPLKSIFLKIKEDFDNIPLDDLSREEIDVVGVSVYDLGDLLSDCEALLKTRIERKQRLMKCYSPMEFFYLSKTKTKLRKIEDVLQGLRKQKMSPSRQNLEAGPPESQTEYEWSYGAVDISKIYGNVQSILDEKEDRDELGILLFMLYLQLLDKRYLIVFDDIWEATDWHTSLLDEPTETKEWKDRLAYGLPKGNGSAIIVTSRIHEVARRMVGRMHMHHPKPLLDENGWLLFKSAYEEVRPFDESLESMKSAIIVKCSGLPLALKTAGRELARMKQEEDDNSNPQAPEEGEAKDGDSAKPQVAAQDINKPDTDETRKLKPTNSTVESKPQDDDTSELKAEKSMQLEDASKVSKTDDTIKPSDDGKNDTKDTDESHISMQQKRPED